MGRRTAITFVPSASKNGAPTTPLDLIPVEVKREAEAVYFMLQSHDGRMHLEFDTADEVKAYRRQVESYCKNRPEDVATIRGYFDGVPAEEIADTFGKKTLEEAIVKGGPIRFRQSPVKDQPDTMIDFRIVDLPKEDPNTNVIREATAAANAPADPPADTAPAAAPTPTPAKAAGRRK